MTTALRSDWFVGDFCASFVIAVVNISPGQLHLEKAPNSSINMENVEPLGWLNLPFSLRKQNLKIIWL
jgi:hypothetical protein